MLRAESLLHGIPPPVLMVILILIFMNDLDALAGLNSNINNLTGTLVAGAMQDKQIAASKELQRMSQEWQVYLWRLAQQYNLPINEVRRLLDAGINPAMAFSNGGASAAPVPTPPQNQAASGTPYQLSNPILAASQAAVADSQVDLNNATADRQEAEAEVARKEAGLTDTRQQFEAFRFGVEKEVRDLIISDRHLGNYIKKLDASIGYNDYVRSDVYTTNYPQLLGQEMETNRVNINRLHASIDEIEEHVNLMRKQGRFTDDQAKAVRQSISIRVFDAMLSEFKAKALKDAMDTKYQGDDGQWHDMVDKFAQTFRNRFEEDLRRSETGYIEAGLDLDFQEEFGGVFRDLQYEGARRDVSATRTRQWTSVLSAISGMGMMLATGVNAGVNMRHVKALQKHWQSTARQFGSPLVVPHYSGGNVMIPPVYSPYGPFGEY